MLKELMRQKSLSVQKLSSLTSIPVFTLEKYLQGDFIFDEEDLIKLAKALEIDQEKLKQNLLIRQFETLKKQNQDLKKNTTNIANMDTISKEDFEGSRTQ